MATEIEQAERTSLALQRNHPELKNVWSDLEKNKPVRQPRKAVQPTNLKLKLLPFQLESLFWMKKQEQGVWRGGMLAVRIEHLVVFSGVNFLALRTKWGMILLFSSRHADSDLLQSMGKTIQIISLFVSDSLKPNLVVACVMILDFFLS